MKSIKQSLVLVMVAFVTVLLFVGCSQKPSNSEIKEAIEEAIEEAVKEAKSWVGDYKAVKEAVRIDSIETKEWGSFNKEQKYWPAKFRVVGSVDDLLNPGNVKQFDEVSEFRFYKDDYGKWKANLRDRKSPIEVFRRGFN